LGHITGITKGRVNRPCPVLNPVVTVDSRERVTGYLDLEAPEHTGTEFRDPGYMVERVLVALDIVVTSYPLISIRCCIPCVDR